MHFLILWSELTQQRRGSNWNDEHALHGNQELEIGGLRGHNRDIFSSLVIIWGMELLTTCLKAVKRLVCMDECALPCYEHGHFFALAVSACSRWVRSWRHASNGGGTAFLGTISSCRQRIIGGWDGIRGCVVVEVAHSDFLPHGCSLTIPSVATSSGSLGWIERRKDEHDKC